MEHRAAILEQSPALSRFLMSRAFWVSSSSPNSRPPSRAILAGLLCVLLSAQALGKSDRWPRCRGADPEIRVAACSEIIARGSRETKRNRVAAYINRATAYRAKADLDRALADFD